MNLTPNQLKNLNVSICGDACWVFCTKCKARQQVAFGLHVSSMTRKTIMRCLIMLDWQASPCFLCTNCRPPFESRTYGDRLKEVYRDVAENDDRPPTGAEIQAAGWNA